MLAPKKDIAMKKLAAALVLLVAFGTAARADTPDFKATAHTVMVLSLVGDELIFDTGAKAVSGAGFDAIAERAMVLLIKVDLPGATVTAADAPHAELLTELYPAGGDNETGMGNLRQVLRLWAVVLLCVFF